ncbi:MAG: VacJ family lipoprotein [gamma proteobacterium symbiont of Bathyaustriella thionipta]|nr:VacJ family lipoprotein [gamma proteobacterium symbiont of Bathyaustriella thionipta]MCU7949136.1 VacJ family lipoprotein [gamma proteobacterium symbiont of Bathyaustriella thionipta]MCU7952245.1 VacJ family lipoprotein [gamma proteobacterium symbiont of Bathyaustriella thionipta]MCU7955795.1 VacJ family lipoprotein [gamma proteobacterium symbiont of Bathyaustriella thionipta]MCU7968037.1 VacJ family lipoprotein [gamma proteobacterium symbiont of Bathyaustriella thionipta]
MKNSFIKTALLRQYILIFVVLLLLSACSAVPPQEAAHEEPAMHPVSDIVKDDVIYPIDVYDPWEGMNRHIYIFNAHMDDYVLLPVLEAYQNYVPFFLRRGIHNFYSNLTSFEHTVNSGLQLNGEATANNGLRFLSNSTIGLFGVFDVATGMGFPEMKEDFGQTMGYWGVGEGPYIVLPLLGPSNLRDTTGLATDFFIISDFLLNETGMNGNEGWLYFYYMRYGVDARAKVPFRYYESGSPFEYETMRLLYTSGRKVMIGE